MSVARSGNDIDCSLVPRVPSLKAGAPVILSLVALAATGCAGPSSTTAPVSPAPERYPIVPAPRRLEAEVGRVPARSDDADHPLRSRRQWAPRALRDAGRSPPGGHRASAAGLFGTGGRRRARRDRDPADAGVAPAEPEGYRLIVTGRGATLSAPTPAGLFYGPADASAAPSPGIRTGGPHAESVGKRRDTDGRLTGGSATGPSQPWISRTRRAFLIVASSWTWRAGTIRPSSSRRSSTSSRSTSSTPCTGI